MLNVRPLRSPTFRHLAVGYWINELGNWIGEIALAILVFNRTHSPLATATLFLALRFLPSVLAPVLTVRCEALRPRSVLSVLYLLEGIFFCGMALVTHHFSLPLLLVLCALDGMLAITAKALTRGVSATLLIRQHLLREGNGILNLGVMASSALGPALGGVAVAWKGSETALLVDAGTFVITAVVVATAPGLRLESDPGVSLGGRLREGVGVLRAYSAVRRLLLGIALVMMLGSVAVPIEVVFAKQTLHAGDTGYGLLLGGWGIGMVVGGAAFAAASQIRLIRLLTAGTVLAVLGYAGLALAPTLVVACAFSALGGAGNGAGWIAAVTAVQERIPITSQSRVMSVLEGINQLMPAIGFVIGGAVTAASSPRVAYAVSAGGVALVAVLFGVWRIDRVSLSPVSEQEEEETIPTRERVQRQEPESSAVWQELVLTGRTLP